MPPQYTMDLAEGVSQLPKKLRGIICYSSKITGEKRNGVGQSTLRVMDSAFFLMSKPGNNPANLLIGMGRGIWNKRIREPKVRDGRSRELMITTMCQYALLHRGAHKDKRIW